MNGNICKIHTNGNKYSHIILRGGGGKTNYDEESVKHTITKLQSNKVRDIIFIDFSHGNSNKIHKNQLKVCDNVCNKTVDKIGYKYPLCCLAVWILGIAVFAIIISENAK